MRTMTNPISKHQRIVKSNRIHAYGSMVCNKPSADAKEAFEHIPYYYLNRKKEDKDGKSGEKTPGTVTKIGRETK